MKIQKETLETKDNMATKINMDRYVWEGWTVGAFIRELAPQVEMAGGNDHERAKLEGTFQEQTGTGGLVQGQPALLQEKDP